MSLSSDVYYITLSGAGRRPLFNDDEDRRRFTQVVSEAAAACRVTVHAYCWLPSEARMAAQIDAVSPDPFAQRIADQYARPEGGISVTGPRFEQKCRAVPVDGRTALPDLVRHIHLAPLKAGLSDHLLGYPWSSHRVYLGLVSARWVTTAATLQFFENPLDPNDVYRGLFR